MTAWRASVEVQRGEFTLDVTVEGDADPLALVGPNGSGKSTFLRALAGAIPVGRADVVVGDLVMARTSARVNLPMERRRIGYVPQGYGLFPHLGVLDNVAFGLSTGHQRISRAARRDKARAMLGELQCGALADRSVASLSGGEQQRVALARALVLDPAMLLLDEPLAALDATTRRQVRRFLAERLRALGRPCVVVTHDVRDVAALGASVCALSGGRVLQRGSLEQVRSAPASPFLADFVRVD